MSSKYVIAPLISKDLFLKHSFLRVLALKIFPYARLRSLYKTDIILSKEASKTFEF